MLIKYIGMRINLWCKTYARVTYTNMPWAAGKNLLENLLELAWTIEALLPFFIIVLAAKDESGKSIFGFKTPKRKEALAKAG